MLTKTQLKAIFEEYALAPLKRLGENYLIDGNIKDKIIKEARIEKDDVVLEIGPGLGALTMDLAATGAKVYAVEKDRKAVAILRDLAGGRFPNLEIYHEDILKFDIKKIPSGKKIKVLGSIPYYITTPVLEYIIDNKKNVESALIVIQKEVAVRMSARPGSKEYGSLSCFVQYHAKVKNIYTIKRTSFYPVPDVDSSLVRLEIPDRPTVSVKDEELLFRIIRGAFNQRRKAILNSLAREEVLDVPKEELAILLEKAGIGPAKRPETLGLADFASIANLTKQGRCGNV